MTDRPSINPGFLWAAIAFLLVFTEGITIGRPGTGNTLSEVIRADVRFDPLGRWLLLPLWTWLSWHWLLRPRGDTSIGWRDAIALVIGLAWAARETITALR